MGREAKSTFIDIGFLPTNGFSKIYKTLQNPILSKIHPQVPPFPPIIASRWRQNVAGPTSKGRENGSSRFHLESLQSINTRIFQNEDYGYLITIPKMRCITSNIGMINHTYIASTDFETAFLCPFGIRCRVPRVSRFLVVRFPDAVAPSLGGAQQHADAHLRRNDFLPRQP